MTTREMIEIMEAYERGEQIIKASKGVINSYKGCTTPQWDWLNYDYRIKPKEPKMITVMSICTKVKLIVDGIFVLVYIKMIMILEVTTDAINSNKLVKTFK